MELEMLIGKIHRATVTEANVDYVGSITIDRGLFEAAGLLEYQKVQVVDVDNGNRLETYIIAAPVGSGTVCLNGAAAHCVEVGDRVIIMGYGMMDAAQAQDHHPNVVFVDGDNAIVETATYETYGQVSPR